MDNKIEVTYINNQDDFFDYSLFEKYWDCLDNKKLLPQKLKKQIIFLFICALVVVFVPGSTALFVSKLFGVFKRLSQFGKTKRRV